MKKNLHLLIIIALALITTACNRQDDLDDIFVGKTWYMMNGVFNSQRLDTKSFYKYEESGYQLHFQANQFSGELVPGVSFSGYWHGDGKNRTLKFTVNSAASTSNDFDTHVYNIIKNASYYTGDDNILTIYADKDDYISFSTSRSSQSQN